MRVVASFVLIVMLLVAGPNAWAVQPDEILSDAGLEARARTLSKELRCMVCQNQSIDDSEAPLARDLRLLVRERIAAGDSDAQVTDFLVARYGEFVLLKPRLKPHTLLLWLVPPLALAGGGFSLWMHSPRRPRSAGKEDPSSVKFTPEGKRRLGRLVPAETPGEGPAHLPPNPSIFALPLTRFRPAVNT